MLTKNSLMVYHTWSLRFYFPLGIGGNNSLVSDAFCFSLVGVGDVSVASNVVSWLISKGSDVSQKCRWTDMLPLHYASFFDAAPILRVLLKASNARGKLKIYNYYNDDNRLKLPVTEIINQGLVVFERRHLLWKVIYYAFYY